MELDEVKAIWQSYDSKLQKSLKLNMHCLEMIQAQKVKSKLGLLLRQRVLEIIVHVIIIFWLITFLYKHFFEIQFAAPAFILICFFATAFITCVKQIIIIKQMDFSDDIVTIQSSLVMLQANFLNYVKLTFLHIPTYLAYPIIGFKALANFDMVSRLSGNWWTAQIIFTVILIPVCVWLYRQVSYKNIHKRWVKYIVEKSFGSSFTKAVALIRELETLKLEYVQLTAQNDH